MPPSFNPPTGFPQSKNDLSTGSWATSDRAGRPASAPSEGVVRHLYVHIPFCHRICPYCGFHKHTPGGHDIPAFFRALVEQARRAADDYDLNLRTVYFGGGTPTLPSRKTLDEFLLSLKHVIDLSGVEEFSVEANPRTFDRGKVDLLRDHGVTRVSLGVQAWDEQTLATLGRDHSPLEAEEAYAILRAAGIPVVNIDLMFSIPGQTLEAWRATLEKTTSLAPEHVSAYNLNYEEDTEFLTRFQRGEFTTDPEADAEFFEVGIDHLTAAGLEQYEISNYARPSCESLHNQAYWQGADYLGLGPGAVSTVTGRRWKTLANTSLFTTLAARGESIETEVENLIPGQLRTERIALSLRTRAGAPLSLLGTAATIAAQDLVENGLATITRDRLTLTRRGRLVADSVTAHLLDSP
jgi:putative oxygen-independent coproporphyrinogen III oxidase